MRPFLKILIALIALVGLWFTAWYFMLSGDVARVKASIAYQDQRFKEHSRYVTLKAENVRRAGFPFALRVRIVHPTLTMIWQQETYGVEADWIDLESSSAGEGRYRFSYPETLSAVYAKDGELPEQYFVSFTPKPAVLVRAAGNSNQCAMFPGGKPCPDVAADAPLNAIAFSLGNPLLLHIARGKESRDVSFNPVTVQVPVFIDIPGDINNSLELAIEILREAFRRPAQ